MDKQHYDEMLENFEFLKKQGAFQNKEIYLFGHCNATEELAKLFIKNNFSVSGIFDNNVAKQGTEYNKIPIISPDKIISENTENILVCIVARACEAMVNQLKKAGFAGRIEKLVDYNSFAEYSLSDNTIKRKSERAKRGMDFIKTICKKYPDYFRIYCPFQALGDVFYAMSYLPYFLKKRNINKYVVLVIGNACAEVVRIFGVDNIEVMTQKEMDESVQAVIYTNDDNAYIAHQDRPYTIYLSRALYLKKITLEEIYKYGVYGLDRECEPIKPSNYKIYGKINEIPKGKSVIISPYAKSVTNIPEELWRKIAEHFKRQDFEVFTSAVGDEKELEGTKKLSVRLSEFQSAVEYAGVFVGLRSGLCDVIKYADCKKIALYPDCFYSDTKWKMEEIYHLDGWENIVVK